MLSSMLASPLLPSLLDTYILSTSSLGCNALYMAISFLVLWSICLSSSLIHFKNGPEYFTSGDSSGIYPFDKVFIESFSNKRWLMAFHWSLSDSNSLQISRTLLSILVDLNNAVVWMVYSCRLTSNSSSLFSKSGDCSNFTYIQLVSSSPSNSIVFFSSLARSKYLYRFLLFFIFNMWSA